jgi:hypothetical protein
VFQSELKKYIFQGQKEREIILAPQIFAIPTVNIQLQNLTMTEGKELILRQKKKLFVDFNKVTAKLVFQGLFVNKFSRLH